MRGLERRSLTVVEIPTQLMVGTPFHHFSHVLSLLVDGHSADDAPRGRGSGQFDLDGARLGNLAVQLLQQGRVLGEPVRESRFVLGPV